MLRSVLLTALLGAALACASRTSAAPGLALVPLLGEDVVLRRPLHFGHVPGTEATHVVALQGGELLRFELTDSGAGPLETWLDLSARTSRRGNEEGLLGVAFHPAFPRDPRVFVHYSLAERRAGRLASFEVPAEGPIDPATERVVLEVDQPFRNHNGGALAFGPDGFLYVGLGDGGSAGDPERNGQDPGTLLGAILRLDVDGAEPYAVPDDNPFVGREGARAELWALGLRNPWRFDFDPLTGVLWVGDVGQLSREEISVAPRGGNLGWRRFEGELVYDEDEPLGPGALVEPVLDYPRADGISVTGGVVYRGEEVPSLAGRYLFADYGSGSVWSVRADPDDPGEKELVAKAPSPASFGRDARGEVVLCCFDGRLYRIAAAEAETYTRPPE